MISAICLFLLIFSIFASVCKIQLADSSSQPTIYIMPNGLIEGTTEIRTSDNMTYVFTGDIFNQSIVVGRNNIAIDGNGHTLQENGSDLSNGIYLPNVSNVTITETSIINSWQGIYLLSSSGNTLSSNNITACHYGIYLNSSSNNLLSGNNVTTDLSAYQGAGITLDSSCYNNAASGNNIIAGWGFGIRLGPSSASNVLSNNTISDSDAGAIYVNSLSKNTFTGNNITDNDEGLALGNSFGSVFSDNIVARNTHGIDIWSSSGNVFSGNNLTGNDVAARFGDSSNNVFSGNNVAANINGIELQESSDNNVLYGNNIANHVAGMGVWLSSSNNNVLSGNNMTDNGLGVWLTASSHNAVYHNNFANNYQQVSSDGLPNTWDNGYPSGGNYWSDYNGTDLYNGPTQNMIGSDGVGDTHYVIDANNTDNNPLMTPWSTPDIAVTNLTSAKVVIGQGYPTLVDVNFENLGSKIEAFNATVYANETSLDLGTLMLTMGNSVVVGCNWNTTGFAYGNYTISASANILEGDTNVTNNLKGGWVVVTIPGDINGDFKVSLTDLVLLANAYGSRPSQAKWNPNADINGNGVVDLTDLVLLALHYGQHFP